MEIRDLKGWGAFQDGRIPIVVESRLVVFPDNRFLTRSRSNRSSDLLFINVSKEARLILQGACLIAFATAMPGGGEAILTSQNEKRTGDIDTGMWFLVSPLRSCSYVYISICYDLIGRCPPLLYKVILDHP